MNDEKKTSTPSSDMSQARFETRAVHVGYHPDAPHYDISQPLHLSTTFERGSDGGYPGGFDYTRTGNPNRAVLETSLASLEGGSDCIAFASGLAAISAVLQALSPKDHILIPHDMYFGAKVLIEDVFKRWGLEASACDMSNTDAVEAALRPNTRLIWMETPSNPLLHITDLAKIASIARAHGVMTCVDNTWPTPFLQTPLALGVDIVMHSTSKALAGHSDVLGGALVFKETTDWVTRIRSIQKLSGGVPAPFDCWLVQRGMQSLAARQRVACDSADNLAARLLADPRVENVLFPGLSHHIGHDIARAQMNRFGSMMSVIIKGGLNDTLGVSHNMNMIRRATSLGGTHSLVEHRASIEGSITLAPDNLLRFSVGLEHVDDIWADWDHALG